MRQKHMVVGGQDREGGEAGELTVSRPTGASEPWKERSPSPATIVPRPEDPLGMGAWLAESVPWGCLVAPSSMPCTEADSCCRGDRAGSAGHPCGSGCAGALLLPPRTCVQVMVGRDTSSRLLGAQDGGTFAGQGAGLTGVESTEMPTAPDPTKCGAVLPDHQAHVLRTTLHC